ncbi:MAG: hypothetical protein ABSH47_13285 [Bryobacteraceae bacterium]|jgi:hypothetical protein
MHRIARFSCFAVVTFATAVQAQSVISARSGTIHYVEGKALLNDQEISPKFGEFPAMNNGAILRTTAEGRVEVLLTPGVILRVGESSSIRMVANSLADTRVELQAGKAVLECSEILKGDAIALLVGGKSVSFAKNGLYEATAEPPSVRVYKGEAMVLADGKQVIVKRGHEALLGNVVTAQKFDDNVTDDLYNWSSRRSGYLALANVSAARSMSSGYNGYGYAGGGWAWNPWFGMFTWVPMSGMGFSPFGYGFYSPYGAAYYNPYYYGYGGGYGGGSGTGTSTYSGRPVMSATSGSYGGETSVSSGRMGSFSGGSSGGGGFSGGGDGGGRSTVGSTGGGGSAGRGGH